LAPLSSDEQTWQDSRKQLDKELAQYPWLRPITLEGFGGKIDPEKVNFPWKMFFRQMLASDHRDWDAIRGWTRELPIKLQP
jgi:menaquinone-dependent protoporphyrinogen oxidase